MTYKHKVYILDTNIVLCLVDSSIHGKIGDGSEWNKEIIEGLIEHIDGYGETIAIPLPMIIEASNIIGHDIDNKAANHLIEYLNNTFEGKRPFREFGEQRSFWEHDKLLGALEAWKPYINNKLGLGDFLVLLLKDYYEQIHGFEVEILTADNSLDSFKDMEVFNFKKSKESAVNRRGLR